MNPLQHSRLLSEINDLSKSGWFTHLWLVLSPFNCNDYSPLPGKRLLALATCRCPIKEMKLSKESVLGENQEAAQAGRYRLPHNSLSLLGVIAVGDQPRVMCKRSLELAAKAGVQVVMVTGDRIATAVSVAKTIGLVQDDEKGGASLSKTNSALTDPNQPLESTLTSRISLGFLLSSDLAQMSDRQLEIVSC
jgi:magnesium-transporting ATPase (P-type)